MFLDHLRSADHWFKFATLRPTDPLLPCATLPRFTYVVPQLRRRLFQKSRRARCAALSKSIASIECVAHASFFWFLQPHKLLLCKYCIALRKKFAVLIFAHGIHRVAKMFGNMKSIKRNLVGQVLLNHVDIPGPHIHRGDGDRRALRLVKRSEIAGKTFLGPSVHHCNHAGIVDVCRHRHILVEFLKKCFVNSNACWRNLFAARESACHGARHNAVDFVPAHLKLTADCGLIGVSQPINRSTLEERREVRTAISPWRDDLHHVVLGALHARNVGDQRCFVLTTIKISPRASTSTEMVNAASSMVT